MPARRWARRSAADCGGRWAGGAPRSGGRRPVHHVVTLGS